MKIEVRADEVDEKKREREREDVGGDNFPNFNLIIKAKSIIK